MPSMYVLGVYHMGGVHLDTGIWPLTAVGAQQWFPVLDCSVGPADWPWPLGGPGYAVSVVFLYGSIRSVTVG